MPHASLALRDELISLLTQATELEHSLSCSYLFTAFTLKTSVDEGLPAETVESVMQWKRSITQVAIEEMFHLAVVNHLLIALGAAPNFDRPNFPHDCSYYMPDFQIELRPFNEDVMRHFIAVEQPDGMNMPALIAPERILPIEGHLENEVGAEPMQFDSQGDVYTMVQAGLTSLAGHIGEENLFIGPEPSGALRQFLEGNGWETIHNLESCFRDLAKILEQGEGNSSWNPDSHYERFQTVLREYLEYCERFPGFNPARNVLDNPFPRTPPEASGPVNLIDDRDSIRVADLFNEAYVGMLQLLARFFVTTEETEAEATALCDAAVDVMIGGIVPLGELLSKLPAGPGHPDHNAGASFVVRTLHPLPYKGAAWRLLHERFHELQVYTKELSESDLRLSALSAVSDTFGRVVATLEPGLPAK